MRKNQTGLAHLALLLIIVTAVIAAVGFNVFSRSNAGHQASVTTKQSAAAPSKKIVSSTTQAPKATTTPLASTPAATTAPKAATPTKAAPAATPKTTPSPSGFSVSYLLNSGAPNTNIPPGKSSFVMPCYKGGGSDPDSGRYTVTAQTTTGDVQVTFCYYQSFSTTILPNYLARLSLADGQYIDVPYDKGGGPYYQPSCNGTPASGPVVPVFVNSGSGLTISVRVCSYHKFATSAVY